MRISDWSSDVCSSDLRLDGVEQQQHRPARRWPPDLGHVEPERQHAVGQLDRHGARGRRPHARSVADHHDDRDRQPGARSEEHTSELQSLMRISYAVFCLKKKTKETENQKYKLR